VKLHGPTKSRRRTPRTRASARPALRGIGSSDHRVIGRLNCLLVTCHSSLFLALATCHCPLSTSDSVSRAARAPGQRTWNSAPRGKKERPLSYPPILMAYALCRPAAPSPSNEEPTVRTALTTRLLNNICGDPPSYKGPPTLGWIPSSSRTALNSFTKRSSRILFTKPSRCMNRNCRPW